MTVFNFGLVSLLEDSDSRGTIDLIIVKRIQRLPIALPDISKRHKSPFIAGLKAERTCLRDTDILYHDPRLIVPLPSPSFFYILIFLAVFPKNL